MILVTGGSGFIGSHLLERLTQCATPVRCLLRRKSAAACLPKQFEPCFGDLAGGQGIENALRDVETVIHLAGVTKALRPDDYYAGNMRATETLAHLIAKRDIRLVHVSSLAAVGPGSDGTPLSEDSAAHPIGHYGKSKLEAELIVRHLVPAATIVRPPVVYGPRDTDVYPILKSIARGLTLEISGSERWFSAIFVGDLVDGILAAALLPQAKARTYFLAHPEPVSWTGLRHAAASIIGRQPRVLRIPMFAAKAVGFGAECWSKVRRKPGIVSREKVREAEARWWVCDTRRAAVELDFHARTSLDAGVARTLAWYKEAGWLHF